MTPIKMAAVVSLWFLAACNYNHSKQEATAGGPTSQQQSLDLVDFKTVQAKIIGPKCLGCHSGASGNQGGTNLESYTSVRRLMNRISFRALEKGDMPPSGKLTSGDADLLKNWFEMGAPESVVGTEEKSDMSIDQGPTDWAKISQRLFSKKCMDCHSQPQPQGNLDLGSYEEVKAKATLIFDRVIIRQDMPVEPYPALSLKERKVFLNWMNMGLPR